MQVPKSVQLAGLAALAIADVALIVAVLQAPDQGAARTPTTSPTKTTTTTAAASATTTSSAKRASVRAMAVVDGTVAYRAAAAGCSVSDPGLEKSTDGGQTWSEVTVDGPRSIVRIEFTSTAEGYVIGTDEECDLKVWRTSSGGADWTEPGPSADFWSALPASTTQVNSVGQVRTPCPRGSAVAQVVRVTDANTHVLCSKGEIRTTTDGGAAWSTTTTVAGALALAVDKDAANRLVVAGTEKGCQGIRIWSLEASAEDAEERGCVSAAKPSGPIALDAGGSSVWLSLDKATWVAAGSDLMEWKQG